MIIKSLRRYRDENEKIYNCLSDSGVDSFVNVNAGIGIRHLRVYE